jgi:hypothetical protein
LNCPKARSVYGNQSLRIQLFPSWNQVTVVYVSVQIAEEYFLSIHKAVFYLHGKRRSNKMKFLFRFPYECGYKHWHVVAKNNSVFFHMYCFRIRIRICVSIVLVVGEVPKYEDVWRSEVVLLRILNLCSTWRPASCPDSFMSPRNENIFPLNMMLGGHPASMLALGPTGGPPNRYGLWWKKNLLSLPRIEAQLFVQPIT